MAQFFDLPLEIRFKIYQVSFGNGVVVLGGRQDTGVEARSPNLLPCKALAAYPAERSGQLLRVCRTILFEARPMLYSSTNFQTQVQAFAGRLPTRFTTEHPSAALVRHLTWQLKCDLLKRFTLDEVDMERQSLLNLQTLELRCQSENWRGSVAGEWSDEEAFERGRRSMIELANLIKNKMEDVDGKVALEEDQSSSDRRKMCLRLTRLRRLSIQKQVIVC